MIDANRLFGYFDNSGKTPEELKAESKGFSKEIKESPAWKVNMFRRIISNHLGFQQKISLFFKQKNKNWGNEDSEEHTNFVVYNRAWHYIKDVDLNDKYYVMELIDHDPLELSYCLQLTLKYFENKEEYQRCAHLFKIIKFLEEVFEKSLE